MAIEEQSEFKIGTIDFACSFNKLNKEIANVHGPYTIAAQDESGKYTLADAKQQLLKTKFDSNQIKPMKFARQKICTPTLQLSMPKNCLLKDIITLEILVFLCAGKVTRKAHVMSGSTTIKYLTKPAL